MPTNGEARRVSHPLRRKERVQELSPRDRLRVEFTLRGSDVVGAFVPCRRYDTDHGMFHVHPEAWRSQPNRRDPIPVMSLNDALTRAIADLTENYATYRAHLEAYYSEERP